MSDWPNLDVTPVGGAPGARADRPLTASDDEEPAVAGVAGLPPGDDPFGSRPTVRRRGWVRLVLGVVLLLAGIGATAAGILQAVDARERIDADAVARGTLRAGDFGRPLAFEVPPGERRRYTVWLLFEGLFSDSDMQDLTARDTACAARMPDGVATEFRGARQTVSATLGNAVSVGTFTSLPGPVSIVCGYTSGTRGSRRQRPDAVPYVVSEGAASFTGSGVLTIIAGVTGATAGGFLVAWGWRGRRRLVR